MIENVLSTISMEEDSESWYTILRIPNSMQNKFDKAIRNQQPIKLKFNKNVRVGIIRFDNEELEFIIKDLPCVVELSQCFSKSDVYKIDNVSQILLCSEPLLMKPKEVDVESGIGTVEEEAMSNNRYPHGLTPSMKNVVKHRFRTTKKSRYIDAPQIDLELKRIFRRDMEATRITYTIIEDDGTEVNASSFGVKPVVVENRIASFAFNSPKLGRSKSNKPKLELKLNSESRTVSVIKTL